MRIAIDAYNLGLLEGTGIATYARELSRVLRGAGHEVYPIYELHRVARRSSLAWPSFVQALAVRPSGLWAAAESAGRILSFVSFAARSVLRVPVTAREVAGRPPAAALAPLAERLPGFDRMFNLPGVFTWSEYLSYFGGAPTTLRMGRQAEVDVFHMTLPLPVRMKNAANVVTVHDLIPLTLPHSTGVDLKRFRANAASSFRRADKVFCVSESSKAQLVEVMGVPEEKAFVTYQAVDIPSRFLGLRRDDVEPFIERAFGLKWKEYFLFYGAIEPKKNVARIIDAKLRATTDFPLVIVGKNAWLFADVNQRLAVLEKRVRRRNFRRLEYASFDTLMRLVKGARALVFPSLAEGFGLPVLEAMHMGCPVITSRPGALGEVGGDAVHYVDPLDVGEIAGAMDRLASDEELASQLVRRGHQQCEKFSVARYRERLEEGYRLALR